MKQENWPLAILFAVAGAFFYAMLSVCAKLALPTTPFPIIVFFRFLLCFIFIFIVSLPHGIGRTLQTCSIKLTLIRGVLAVAAVACLFFSLHSVPASVTVLLSSIDPLLIPIVLWLFRGVAIIPSLYIGIGLGFVGIALVLHPGGGYWHLGAVLALTSGVLRAVCFVIAGWLSKRDSRRTIMFYFFLIGTAGSGAFAAFSWHDPVNWAWPALLGVGVSGLLFQWCITSAFSRAPVRVVAPIAYLSVVFSAVPDYLIWGHVWSVLTAIGAMLAIAGVVSTVWLAKAKIAR